MNKKTTVSQDSSLFSSQSSLAAKSQNLLDYVVEQTGGQYRAGQHEMVELVSDSIQYREHVLVQAGTGTGKSLAYLIPAVVYETSSDYGKDKKPILIATATIALQTQIIDKDIPRLLAVLDKNKKLEKNPYVALQKGRSNYVCKYKLAGGFGDDSSDEPDLFNVDDPKLTKTGEEVLRVRQWAEITQTGNRDELTPGVSDQAWKQVSVNSQQCIAKQCPMIAECFSEKAKEEAQNADIVVTNHALLALDSYSDNAILPDFGSVIIDEAHEFEERVTSALSDEISAQIIHTASAAIRKISDIETTSLDHAADNLTALLKTTKNGLIGEKLDNNFLSIFDQIYNASKTIFADSSSVKTSDKATNEDPSLATARQRIMYIRDLAMRFMSASDNHDVIWVYRRVNAETPFLDDDLSKPATMVIAPLTISDNLQKGLFANHPVVMTSATLSLGGSFEAIVSKIGLNTKENPDYKTRDVGSPFDYKKQGILYTAADLPKPTQGISKPQLEELLRIVEKSQGGVLGLFSSKKAARQAAEYVENHSEYRILLQGDSTLSSLIDEYKNDTQASLFGTISLWQGVDVPGLTSRVVIIDRIAFPRPDEPLSQAKTEAVNKAGDNGFMTVSAQHAAIRLAQGSGRLIRSTQDKGVVAVLDSRLVTARYGRFLRQCMPDFWQTTDSDVIYRALERLADEATNKDHTEINEVTS